MVKITSTFATVLAFSLSVVPALADLTAREPHHDHKHHGAHHVGLTHHHHPHQVHPGHRSQSYGYRPNGGHRKHYAHQSAHHIHHAPVVHHAVFSRPAHHYGSSHYRPAFHHGAQHEFHARNKKQVKPHNSKHHGGKHHAGKKHGGKHGGKKHHGGKHHDHPKGHGKSGKHSKDAKHGKQGGQGVKKQLSVSQQHKSVQHPTMQQKHAREMLVNLIARSLAQLD